MDAQLLQILVEETEREVRSNFYEPGYEVEGRALLALISVLTNAQRRLDQEV
jgi:hypothetical protein